MTSFENFTTDYSYTASYPRILAVDYGYVFDWMLHGERSIDDPILNFGGSYFLVYDYRSTTTAYDAWQWSNGADNEQHPQQGPGSVKLTVSIIGKNPEAQSVTTVEGVIRVVDNATGSSVVNGGEKTIGSMPFDMGPAGSFLETSAGWWGATEFPGYGAGVTTPYTRVGSTLQVNITPPLIGYNLDHGKKYRAEVRFFGKNSSGSVIGASDWIPVAHLLHVNVRGPVVTITNPTFPLYRHPGSGGDVYELVVEEQGSVTVNFTTSKDSEVRFRKDYTYPFGTGYLTTNNSSLISSSGTTHSVVITNPDPANTNGLRFTIAARDNQYKNISPYGWGLFSYNILFKKRAVIVPTVSITGQTTTPVSGGYYDATGLFAFSGAHTNAATVKIELWQSGSKKYEKTCTISGNTWSGNFTSQGTLSLAEGAIEVKAIATSSTSNVAQTSWNGTVLKQPIITIVNPVASSSAIITSTISVNGTVANSAGYLSGSQVSVYLDGVLKATPSVSGTSWTTSITGITSGAHTIRVTAKNTINMEGIATRTFTADLDLPTISVNLPTANTYHKATTLQFSGTCTKTTQVLLEAWQNNAKYAQATATLSSNNTQWTGSLSGLKNGWLDLKVIATYSYNGQTNFVWHRIHIDLVAPTVAIESIVGRNNSNTQVAFSSSALLTVYGQTLAITTSATDSGSGVKKYQLLLNDVVVNEEIKTTGQATLSLPDNVSLSLGSNKVQIRYEDAVGNVGFVNLGGQNYFTVDYVPYNEDGPIVTISSPSNNSTHKSKTVNFTGTCSDVDGVQSVIISAYPPSTVTPYVPYVTANAQISGNNWTGSLSGLSEGQSVIKVHGVDVKGKESTNKPSIVILVDSVAPVVEIVGVSPGIAVTSPTCNITSYATDATTNLLNYEVKVTDAAGAVSIAIPSTNVATRAGAPTKSNLSSPFIDSCPLKPGINIISVIYSDSAGNSQQATKEVTYTATDTTVPTVVIEPEEGHVFSALPINFTVEFKDSESKITDYNVDLFPLKTIPSIQTSDQFYRLGKMVTNMSSSIEESLPSQHVAHLSTAFGTGGAYLKAPNAEYFNGDFTIEARVYPHEPNSRGYLLSFGNAGGNDVVEVGLNHVDISGINTNKPWLNVSGGGIVVSSVPVEANKWSHIAISVAGNSASFYLNGSLVTTTNLARSAQNVLREYCYVGRGELNGSSANGYYSELRVWDSARTQQQIADNLGRQIEPQTGLIAYWKLDETEGTTARDSSGQGRNAIAQDVRWVSLIPSQNRWVLELLSADDNNDFTSIKTPALQIGSLLGVTFESWVYCHENINNSPWFTFSDSTQTNAIAFFLFNTPYLVVKKDGIEKNITLPTVPALNKWMHLAITMSPSGAVKIYKDGTIWGSNTGTFNVFTATSGYIGGSNWVVKPGHITLYNFRIWGLARTDSQILGTMKQTLDSAEGLELNYKLDEGSGQVVYDSSGNAHTGSVSKIGSSTTAYFKWNKVDVAANTDPGFNVLPLSQSSITNHNDASIYVIKNSYKINTGIQNLKTAGTFSYESVQSQHVADGSLVVRADVKNSAGLTNKTFRTFVLDTENPTVIISPANNATVPGSTEITLTFNKKMDKTSVESSLSLIPSNLGGGWEWDTDSKIITYKHSVPFVSGTNITVSLGAGAKDSVSGKYVSSKTSAFTVQDDAKPVIVSIVPEDKSTGVLTTTSISIAFSKRMNTNYMDSESNNIQLINSKTTESIVLSESYSVLEDGKKFVYQPLSALLPGASYRILVSSDVQDVAGNKLSESAEFSFTTLVAMSDEKLVNYTIPVFNGLNGLSIPLDNRQGQYTNITLRSFLINQLGTGAIGAMYWYDTGAQKWVGDLVGQTFMKTFGWQDAVFVRLNLSSSKNLVFSGYLIENGSLRINLVKGLNLIGIPLDMRASGIKSLLSHISAETGQQTFVAYLSRRKKGSDSEETLFGYTYSGTGSHEGIGFGADRLGADAIAIVAEKDSSFLIQGTEWKD